MDTQTIIHKLVLTIDDETKKLLSRFMEFSAANTGAQLISDALNSLDSKEVAVVKTMEAPLIPPAKKEIQEPEPAIQPIILKPGMPAVHLPKYQQINSNIIFSEPHIKEDPYGDIPEPSPEYLKLFESAFKNNSQKYSPYNNYQICTPEIMQAMQDYVLFIAKHNSKDPETNPFYYELWHLFITYQEWCHRNPHMPLEWPYIGVQNIVNFFDDAKRVMPSAAVLRAAIRAQFNPTTNPEFVALYKTVLAELGLDCLFDDMEIKYYPWIALRLNLCMPS
jgi:hypothetical protein